MNPSRREVLSRLGLTAAISAVGLPASSADQELRFGSPVPFSFERLQARAAALARHPFTPRRPTALSRLDAIDFDAIGQIRFRPDASLWKDGNNDGPVEFFHLGRYAREPVTIKVVDAGVARQILYSKTLFDTPAGSLASRLPSDLGFAGFRVMNRKAPGDWIAYLGASYFRSAAPFNQYGLSARGLAIDTATPVAEEFPAFTNFWLGHDAEGHLLVHALLEGRSVVGAYRITHRKEAAALIQDVDASLNFRRSPQRLGIAPLTSMFWYGQGDRPAGADWRPQIHDSDGLAIWTGGGERIWRPLIDPPEAVTNAFLDENPRGFGLMQRDRRFDDYQDDGAFYDRRPSLWVEPLGAWGKGSVQLVELPTGGETDDNIVAFWTPAATPDAGSALDLRYRLRWGDEEPSPEGVARVVSTRRGRGGRPGQRAPSSTTKFVIDYVGGRLATLDRTSGVTPVVTASGGPVIGAVAYPVVGTDRWRLIFDLPEHAGTSQDLRAYLRLGSGALTETWSYQAFG